MQYYYARNIERKNIETIKKKCKKKYCGGSKKNSTIEEAL